MTSIFGESYEGRKEHLIFDGVVMYFPKALAAVAAVSVEGNNQHNPGEPLHWARGKSMDQRNTALRHMIDHADGAKFDNDGCWHLAKAAWRILAWLELEIEADAAKGLARDDEPIKPIASGGMSSHPSATERDLYERAFKKPIPGITNPSLQGQCTADAVQSSFDGIHANTQRHIGTLQRFAQILAELDTLA